MDARIPTAWSSAPETAGANGSGCAAAGIWNGMRRESLCSLPESWKTWAEKTGVDHLTGLPNKVVLEHQVDTLLESNSGKGFAFLLLDLDDFKNINDLYDRLFGDRVLRLLSRRIQSLLPPMPPHTGWTAMNSPSCSAAAERTRCWNSMPP